MLRRARRLEKIPPYLFKELREKILRARAQDIDVINLAIGDPVEPTPKPIIRSLARAAADPRNHQYPTAGEKGIPELRQAVCRWYQERYRVSLDPEEECLILIGSKEGCHYFPLAMVNPGDTVLVTDPGYPAYYPGVWFAGAELFSLPIREEENFLPDLGGIPPAVRNRSSAMILNYPNNPTGAVATQEFLHGVVDFARSNSIAICYDNPYIELVFDDAEPLSILQIAGAKDVALELGSFSKTFNMTGWRLGWAVGNREAIAAMTQVKANSDTGVFAAVQHAGVTALTECGGIIEDMREVYGRRRRLAADKLRQMGWAFALQKGTFYLWIPTLRNMNAVETANRIFEETHVVVAPGTGYGQHGEGYIRISVTMQDSRLEEALTRIVPFVAERCS